MNLKQKAYLLVIVSIVLSIVIPQLIVFFILFSYFLFATTESKAYTLRVPRKHYKQYKVYLSSDEWFILSTKAKMRDKFSCRVCNSGSNLQVHHTHYNGIDTMSFSTNQLVTLCKDCHTEGHKSLNKGSNTIHKDGSYGF